ncbi:5'/3'-nucleotidase SurE [Telmatospirillum siberiense]|uniref:5'-nucleotidase SurE n=1 Tax=Telmatospirillum siberiense TaxID=382514 RepID=A0A2N3PVA6_9PROT|nr:5'/3'-nucleotidase SurE [Telmatospirillum siberiense]PKU24334.1 5'/3'-nucleotidase SurE [Telmatospirillum siberiense]
MRVLLCNDDGIEAPGLWYAYDGLRDFDREVVAPMTDQSGSSHSTSCLSAPFGVWGRQINDTEAMVVDGTPSDAVKFKLYHSRKPFDAMVSGINAGENAGLSQYYSGTVAAAREAAMRGIPSVSISVWRNDPAHYRAAADFLRKWLPQWFGRPGDGRPPGPLLLNVNFPDGNPADIRGIRVARQSMAYFEDHFRRIDGDGPTAEYALVIGEKRQDRMGRESDDWALRHGYVTVVPLSVDTTCMTGAAWLRTIHDGGDGPA